MDETVAKEFLNMLHESAGETAEEEKAKKLSQADVLLEISNTAMLFHDEIGDTYARFPVNGHWEIRNTKAKAFRRWIVGRYYVLTGKAPSPDAVRQVMGVLEARAAFEGPKIELSLRVAERDGSFWYDLADDKWRAVKITSEGWEIVNDPPPIFQRFANTGAQVTPIKADSNDVFLILDYANLKADGEKLLFVVDLTTSLIAEIPHPVHVDHGEKGAAKSTTMRVRRRLTDPAVQELQILPRDHNELALMLTKNWAPSFDNLDGIPGTISDILCVAATGGGISKRELYSDADEVILSFRRCVSLNGINEPASRPDLLDRSLLYELQRIPEQDRKSEAEFWEDFEKVRPKILGAMFSLLSKAIKIYPTVKLEKLPRMADFAKWGYAIAEALYQGGGKDFISALNTNRHKANEEAVSSNPVALAIVVLISTKSYWQGTAAELLTALEEVAASEKIDVHSKSWPRSAKSLAKRIRLVRSNILDAGIDFRETWDTHLKKTIYTLQGSETNPPKHAKSATRTTSDFGAADFKRNSAEFNFLNPPVEPASEAECGIGGNGGIDSSTLGQSSLNWLEGEI